MPYIEISLAREVLCQTLLRPLMTQSGLRVLPGRDGESAPGLILFHVPDSATVAKSG